MRQSTLLEYQIEGTPTKNTSPFKLESARLKMSPIISDHDVLNELRSARFGQRNVEVRDEQMIISERTDDIEKSTLQDQSQ